MFNIWVYILALILGVLIGYTIHLIIQDINNVKDFEKVNKDGIIHIEPKPTRADRYAEKEWREGATRKI